MRRPGAEGISSATLHLLATQGVESTTLRNIAAAAGVTEPAIYRHFASRTDLLGHLFLGCAELLYDELAGAADGVASPLGQLGVMAGAFFEFAFTHPDEYAFILAAHQQQLRDLDLDDVRLPKDLFVDAVRRLQRRKGGAAVPASLAAAGIIGVVMGAILFATTGQTKASRKACREYVTRAVAELAIASCKRPTDSRDEEE
jgi:AcrR family transcriptional regulator